MASIWKTVLTFAVIIFIAAMGIAVTSANVDVTAADNYLEEAAAVIRESNYSRQIISQCQAEAEGNGYILEVELFDGGGDNGRRYARVRLRYKYQFPILQVSDWKKKEKII